MLFVLENVSCKRAGKTVLSDLSVEFAQETTALTVNRLCGSGLQAVVSAAQAIQLSDADVTQLRAELQKQVDEAVTAKAELDAPYT